MATVLVYRKSYVLISLLPNNTIYDVCTRICIKGIIGTI